MSGTPLCTFPRATGKGQWCTDPSHLPDHMREYAEWNGPYFIRKAMTVGPNTVEVVKRILRSRKLEVQTYRMCSGVLGFTRKYSLPKNDSAGWLSYSYRIEAEGKSIVYSGDVGAYSDLDDVIGTGCDILILETGHFKIDTAYQLNFHKKRYH